MDSDKKPRVRIVWNATHPWAYLSPETQHIPLKEEDKALRPPPPRVPAIFDIFLGISAYRDGVRCGFTLFTAYSRAKHPERLFIGLVDQTQDDDAICVEEYCKLGKEAGWTECKYKNQIRVDKRNSRESKGPTVARWQQQQLIRDEEFCMQIDAHSQFLQDWDEIIVKEWLRTENEMAVLTSYPMDYAYIGEGGTINEKLSSHLCSYNERYDLSDIPIISGYTFIVNSEMPQMSTLWGACLSFSKCHAERRASNDEHMNWVFWGEEYLRSMQLWTRGYDLYSPSRHGHIVFHNWSDDKGLKKKFTDNVTQIMTQEQYDMEVTMAYDRLRSVLGLPYNGRVNGHDMVKYYGGKVRTVEQFLKFSGISNNDSKLDEPRCEQLHWVPYSVPEIIEEFLPGWKMRSVPDNQSPRAHVEALMQSNEEKYLTLQTKLDTLLNREVLNQPQQEQFNLMKQLHHQLNELSQPQIPLLSVAFVWLGMITVWLLYGRRRQYQPVDTAV